MRKIISKEEAGKKKKRNQIVVGLVLAFVMLTSVIGYSFMSGEKPTATNKITYKGFNFINQNGFWTLTIGSYNFAFTYNPNEVPKINSQINLLNQYSGKPLYISSKNPSIELEIYRNLDQVILRRQYACLQTENCTDASFPIKTCDDNFIIIQESNNIDIKKDKNCIFIQGPRENLTAVTDEFLFKIIGVE
jgi:hypothetical protein